MLFLLFCYTVKSYFTLDNMPNKVVNKKKSGGSKARIFVKIKNMWTRKHKRVKFKTPTRWLCLGNALSGSLIFEQYGIKEILILNVLSVTEMLIFA